MEREKEAGEVGRGSGDSMRKERKDDSLSLFF